MPTYQYRCPMGHEFEEFERRITDKARAKCPECGKMAQRQISGGAGILFKGSGFYATDYRKPAPKSETGEPKAKGEATKGNDHAPKTDSASKKPSRVKGADH
jgi:putative FmdB family regulatory protein